MNDLSEARGFNKLINYRDIFKRLSQLTWSVRKAEERFPFGDRKSEENLMFQYCSLGKKFISLAEELKAEKENEKDG